MKRDRHTTTRSTSPGQHSARTGRAPKRARRVPAAQGEHYHWLFDHSPEAVVFVDLHNVCLEANPAFVELFGYSRDELVGRNIHELIVPQGLEAEALSITEDIGSGRTRLFETTRRRKNGLTVPVGIVGNVIEVDKKKIGICGIYRDLSLQLEVEGALEESESRYKEIVDNAGDIIFTTDRSGYLLYVNPPGERIMGYDQGRLLGMHYLEVVTPDFRKEVESHYKAQLRSGTANTYFEFPVLTRDGREVWLGQNTQLLVSHGSPVGFQAIARDITRQHSAETRLKQSEEQYRCMMENLPGAVVVHSQETIIYVNPATVRLMGAAGPQDLVGRSIYDFLRDDAATQVRSLNRIWERGESVAEHTDLTVIRLDGSPVTLETTASSCHFGGHKAIQVMGFDKTARLHAEWAIRESEEMHRVLFESSRDAIVLVAPPSWNFVAANAAALELFGVKSATDLINSSPMTFSPDMQPDGRRSNEAARELIQTAAECGSLFFEWQHRRVDGTEFPATVLTTRIELKGQMLLQSTIRDVTLEKAAQSALRDSESRLQGITNVAVNAMIMMNPQGYVTFWNPAATRIFGYSQEQALGQELGALIVPEALRASYHERLDEFKRSHRGDVHGKTLDVTAVNKDGREIVAELSLSLADLSDGLHIVAIIRDLTERREQERELLELVSFLDAALESSTDGILIVDLDQKIRKWNKRFLQMWGIDEAEIAESSYADIRTRIHSQERQADVAGETDDVVERDPKAIRSDVIECADGRVYERYTQPQYRGTEIVGRAWSFHDVTEDRRAARALKENQAKLDLALRSAEMGVWSFDISGNRRSSDRQVCRLLGIDYDTFQGTGEEFFKVIHPDDRESVRTALRKAIEGTQPYSSEYRAIWPDGSVHFLNARGMVVRDEHGSPLQLSGVVFEVTDRKMAEERLRLQGSALEAAANAIVIANREGNIEWANSAFTALTGYSVEEAVGENPRLLKSGKHDESFYRAMWDTLMRGHIWRGEVVNKRKDGTLYDEEMTITPVRDGRGSISHFIAIKEDISERKRAEETVRLSEERFRRVFEEGQLGIMIVGTDRRYLSANNAFCEMIGYTNEELQTRTFEVITYGDALADVRASQLLLSGDKQSYHAEKRYVRKDGTLIWAQVVVRLLRDSQGRPLHFITMVEDITDRKRSEEALAEERALLRTIVDILPIALFVKDTQGRKILANKQDLHNIGKPEWEVLGRTDFEQYDHAFAEAATADDRLVVERGVPVTNREEHFQDPEGREHWALTTKVPRRNSRGEIIGLVGMGLDITERKKTEKALVEAKEAAEAAARAKSEFLAVMSHEIRTPMNGIIATAELLRLTSLSAEQKEYLDIMQSSGGVLLHIINDILDYSKIESGRIELHPESVDVVGVVREVCDLLRPEAQSKGIGLGLAIDASVANRVTTDKRRLKQILFNLIGNGVKFTERGEVVVNMRMFDRANGARCLQCAIRDTGVGIPIEKLDYLFSPFTQVDSSSSRRYGGTGLGLAIAGRLASALGGTIAVESVEGKGSTFTVDIRVGVPERAVAVPVAKRGNGHSPAALERNNNGSGFAILVAEDNLTNQRVIRQILTLLGHHPDIAANGREAIAMIEQRQYQLLLLDIHMPEMNGFETAEYIKQHVPPDRRPVIAALTADVLGCNKDTCQAVGMTYFLTKPVSVDEVRALLEEVKKTPKPQEVPVRVPSVAPAAGEVLVEAAIRGRLQALGLDADPAVAVEFLEAVRGDIALNLEAAGQDAATKDVKAFRLHIHSLKGAARNVGALRLAEACKDIEAVPDPDVLDYYRKNHDLYASAGTEALAALQEILEAAGNRMLSH